MTTSPSISDPPRSRARRIGNLGDKGRIIAMGILLGVVSFLYFFPAGGPTTDNLPPIDRVDVAPELFRPSDAELKKVRDAAASDRSVIEPGPMQHLLELALNMTPDIAQALEMPEQQIPIAQLRRAPERFRGRYMWYKGTLEHFEPIRTKHPVHGYQIYEGHLLTEAEKEKDREVVFFYASKPPQDDLKIGDYARIEGYFMKLRDENLLARAQRGPLLIGKQLKRDYPDWKAVANLDMGVLGRVQNATYKNNGWINTRDFRLDLHESENTPLWHLASYVIEQEARLTPMEVEKIPYFVDKEMLDRFKYGSLDQGAAVRIKGRFAWSRITKAAANPVGIDYWSEVWVQLPRLGGKSVPIWIPQDINAGGKLKRLQDVELVGYYFKNFRYQSVNDTELFTPLFVAGGIKPIPMPTSPFNSLLGYSFLVAVLLLIGIIFVMYRGNVRQTTEHEAKLVARRRRRRTEQLQETSSEA